MYPKVEKAEKEFKKIIKEKPAEARKSVQEIKDFYLEKGMRSGDPILPFFLAANFVTKEQLDDLDKNIDLMTEAIGKVMNAHVHEGMFKKEIHSTESQEELFKLGTGFDAVNIFSRYDLFVYRNKFKLIEINPESPSGMGRLQYIDKIFLKTDIFKRLSEKVKIKKLPNIKKTLLEAFMKRYEEWGGKEDKPTIALVDLEKVKTISDQFYLKEYFEKQGHKTFICTPEDLKHTKEGLMHGEERIDIVYRRFITSEYLSNKDRFKPLINALKKREICMFNPFISSILDDKSFLSELRAGTFNEVLSKDEISAIKEMVPWSMEVNDKNIKSFDGGKKGLEEHMMNKKDELVLNPAISYGGKDIMIGNAMNDKDWKKAVKRTFKESKWIVQEYVNIPTIEVPETNGKMHFKEKYINLCPYVIDGKVAGFLTRISSSKIINTCSGGGIIPTYIIE